MIISPEKILDFSTPVPTDVFMDSLSLLPIDSHSRTVTFLGYAISYLPGLYFPANPITASSIQAGVNQTNILP